MTPEEKLDELGRRIEILKADRDLMRDRAENAEDDSLRLQWLIDNSYFPCQGPEKQIYLSVPLEEVAICHRTKIPEYGSQVRKAIDRRRMADMSDEIELSYADQSLVEVIARYQRENMQASPSEWYTMLQTGLTPLEQRGEVITLMPDGDD